VIGPEGGAWSEGAAGVDVLVMSSSGCSYVTLRSLPPLGGFHHALEHEWDSSIAPLNLL
jgi:hypothetical protein